MPRKYKNEVEERFANIEWEDEASVPETTKPVSRSAASRSKSVRDKTSGAVFGFDKIGQRYFEYRSRDSSKYWAIELDGKTFITTYGRIGTAGQQSTRKFSSALEARSEYDKIVREKVRKGYIEKTK